MLKPRLSLAALIFCVTAGPAAAGTISRIAVAPETITVGRTVTVTVSGTNPCGAANITYGDGESVTYAITGLPYAQSHVYNKTGTYTITGRGMGNCDGDVSTTVTVTGPPPAAASAPQIAAVDMAPSPGKEGEPVTIAVKGAGPCTYEVQYGDGNAQEVTGTFPQVFRHTYAKPDTYTVIVKPTPPCTGKFTQVLQIGATQPQQSRIVRVLISPSRAEAGQPVEITVQGTGACGYTVDFGDGNDEARSAALPDRMRHVYAARGSYNIAARATAPCTGEARERLYVRQSRR